MKNIEKNLKFLIYTGLAILLYVPFIVSSSLFSPYLTGKTFTFRIVVEILVAIWLILAILYPKYRPKKNWILISFVLFALSLFFSNLFGVNQTASFWSNLERMEGWVTIVHLLGLFIVMGSVLRTKKEWYALFNVSLVGSVVMFILGIRQSLGYTNSLMVLSEWIGSSRIYTTIGNPAFLAIYALFNAFLSLLLLFKDTERLKDFFTRFKDTFSKNWPILLYIITFILNTWVLFQTGTRGAMLGFIGGLVLIGLLMAFLEKDKVIYKKIAIGLISAAILFVGTIFSLKDNEFINGNKIFNSVNRFNTIFEFKYEKTNDGNVPQHIVNRENRINNWFISIKGFKERPILGWGQSNFNYVYDKNFVPTQPGEEFWVDRAHNIIFDWLIAGGIFGLFFYLSVWFATVLSIFKTTKLKNIEKSILISMLAGYFVHLLLIFDTLVSYLYFIFLIAFIYAITTKDQKIFTYQIKESLRKIMIVSIIIVTPFVLYLVNYQPYKASEELLKAVSMVEESSDGSVVFLQENPIIDNIDYFQSIINRNTFVTNSAIEKMLTSGNIVFNLEFNSQESQKKNDSIKTEYLNFVYGQVNKQMEKDPYNSKYPFMLSSFLAQTDNFKEAEKNALRAIELSPNKQTIRIPLIRIYSATGQSEKALALAKDTYELDKSKIKLWIEYVKVAYKFDEELFNSVIEEKEEWIKYLPEEIKKEI